MYVASDLINVFKLDTSGCQLYVSYVDVRHLTDTECFEINSRERQQVSILTRTVALPLTLRCKLAVHS